MQRGRRRILKRRCMPQPAGPAAKTRRADPAVDAPSSVAAMVYAIVSAQSLWIGKARQARIQPQDDGVHQGQYHLGQVISAVAPGVGQMRGQEMAEMQRSQKFMEEVNTAIMRQTRMITGDSNIPRRIRHFHEFLTDGWELVKLCNMHPKPVDTAFGSLSGRQDAPNPSIILWPRNDRDSGSVHCTSKATGWVSSWS